jgi:isopenicillin-N N-acyltransferase like protein
VTSLGARAPKDIDAYCARFLADTTLIERARSVTPNLYAELEGIAQGAHQPLARIAAYNLMDEQWWYDASPDAPPPGCSLIAVPVNGGHVLAQNMDLPAHMDGAQVALRLGGPDMPQTIVLSAAGLIGLTGANAAGVAIGVNTLLMLDHAADGLPVAFAMRHALGARDRAGAMARLGAAGHASGQHYAIVSKGGVTAAECSARSCATLPVPEGRALLHTNHPLISRDVDAFAQARLDRAGFNKSSVARLDWLMARRPGVRTSADVQSLFDDDAAPICMRARTNGGSSTFASVLYEMTDRVDVRMRRGIAGSAPWHRLAFSDGQVRPDAPSE